MRKKVFFQLHPAWLLLLTVCVFGVPGYLFVVLVLQIVDGEVAEGVAGLVLEIAVYGYILFLLQSHRVVFKKDSVYVPSDKLRMKDKIQYETEVKYEDIACVEVTKSVFNSVNRPIPSGRANTRVEKHYLELTCKDGRKRRFFIMYFSKRQWFKMIEELKKRMKHCGNNVELPSTQEIIKRAGKLKVL